MEVSFQKVCEANVDALKDIALKTFIQAYRHLNSRSNFERYVQKAFTRKKLLSEIENPDSFFHFVTNEENIIGYLKLNIENSQTENFNHCYLEIERIYLDVAYQRKGIGQRMIQFALDKASELSKSHIWLGVWDQNPEAIRFYEKNGFKITGSHIFKFGDEDQTDIIMERTIIW